MKRKILWSVVAVVVVALAALNVVQRIERCQWVDRYMAKCEEFLALEARMESELAAADRRIKAETKRADDWERRIEFLHEALGKDHEARMTLRRLDLDVPGEHDFDLEAPQRFRTFLALLKLKIVEHCGCAPQPVEGGEGDAERFRWVSGKGLRIDLFTLSDPKLRHHVRLSISRFDR